MAVLDPAVRARREWTEAGRLALSALAWALYVAGWSVAKALRGVRWTIAAALYGVGWLAARALWPAACWCGRAVALGWREGSRPSRP
ncbi:MAG TPA: hypothetical protein VF174_11590 [Micromonosporaceae bacterium]